jgi:hypothetical protein
MMSKRNSLLLGIAPSDGQIRITTGEEFVVLGGDRIVHEVMQDTVIQFNEELKKRGKNLTEVGPKEFVEILEKASRA